MRLFRDGHLNAAFIAYERLLRAAGFLEDDGTAEMVRQSVRCVAQRKSIQMLMAVFEKGFPAGVWQSSSLRAGCATMAIGVPHFIETLT